MLNILFRSVALILTTSTKNALIKKTYLATLLLIPFLSLSSPVFNLLCKQLMKFEIKTSKLHVRWIKRSPNSPVLIEKPHQTLRQHCFFQHSDVILFNSFMYENIWKPKLHIVCKSEVKELRELKL